MMQSLNLIQLINEAFRYDDERVPRKSTEASSVARQEGNKLYISKNHSKKVHLNILSFYNKSLALTEDGSEEMALAYSNRSALLLHLCKYQECLVDIERAHQITKSEELRVKLLTRKMKCMKLMNEKSQPLVKDEDKEIGTIESYAVGKRSKTIPCAYDCVTLAYNEKYGRHLVATKDIEPGQVVVIEKSNVQFPSVDKMYLVCSHCLMFACNGVPCKSCAVAFYCTEKCRDEAWLQYHDVECIVLPYLTHFCQQLLIQHILKLLQIAFRIFIISVKVEGLLNIIKDIHSINDLHTKGEFLEGFFENGVFQNNKFKSIYNLSPGMRPIKETEQKVAMAAIEKIVNLLVDKSNIFDPIKNNSQGSVDSYQVMEIIRKLHLILLSNTFNFEGSNCNCKSPDECKKSTCGEMEIGETILPFCSLFNHSCNFNLNRLITSDQRMVFYAVQPIKKGEQLSITYSASMYMETIDRQNSIKIMHHFTCNCTACRDNWPSYASSVVMLEKSDTADKMFLQIDKIEKSEKIELLHSVLLKAFENWSYDRSFRKKLVRVLKIHHDILSYYKAYMFTGNYMVYISMYFKKFFGAKIFEIPGDC